MSNMPNARVVLTVLTLTFGICLVDVACPGAGPDAVIAGGIVVDCTVQNAGEIKTVFDAIKNALTGADGWAVAYQDAKTAGAAIGGCALVEATQDVLTGKIPLTAKSEHAGAPNALTALQTLQQFRAEVANGATFHTAAGNF